MSAIVANELTQPIPPPWQGELNLTYVWQPARCQTQLQRSHHQSPLKVQRSFYPEGSEVCHTVMLHTAGGIVGGDRLRIQLNLEPRAQAVLTTAAASKLYRSNGPIAHQQITATLAPGARLEWLPQETIAFRGAHYQSQMRVDLAPGATFVGWEITRFGRTARGECFDAGDWRSQLEIWQAGQLQWNDRQWLPGHAALLQSPQGLNGAVIVGTLVWLGEPVSPNLLHQVRNLPRPLSGQTGITTSLGAGLICRYRGNSTAEVRTWLSRIWQHLRQQQWERQPVRLRIWP
ncbi:MAG: urease accessory protein UreD [Spirulina sp. SIO3F2]|nr:urease accessory protein UreD [Spirulina sp. SIO3F2]